MKFKNEGTLLLRFEYDGKEKCVEPGKVIEIPETNSYIDGLIDQGIFVPVEEPKTAAK